MFFEVWTSNSNPGAVCFWQPIPSGLSLVVAVLHDTTLHYIEII